MSEGDATAGSRGEENAPEERRANPRTMHDLWSFKGYRLGPSEFNAAMSHFYRGEVNRSTTWRQRLDATTNWAVVTAGALLTFALGDIGKTHIVIPIGSLLIVMFLFVEARRYRYYELWTARVRLMETDFFAAMLLPPFTPSEAWAEALTSSLLNPQFPISMAEAVGRRLRQNYLMIFLILAVTWVFKVASQPTNVSSWGEFVARAAAGPVPGSVIISCGVIFYVCIIIVAFATMSLQEAPGEVLPRYTLGQGGLAAQLSEVLGRDLTLPWMRRKQHLVYIISEKSNDIGARILSDMDRGVTAISARGLYTGAERPMLMCAMSPADLPRLKHLVREVDAQAFVVVLGASEIHGRGFHPLDVS